MIFLKILMLALIMALFLYTKLLPYKDKLSGQYKKTFDFFAPLFTPLFNGLKSLFPPFQVGEGLSVDMTHIILLSIMLVLLLFLH